MASTVAKSKKLAAAFDAADKAIYRAWHPTNSLDQDAVNAGHAAARKAAEDLGAMLVAAGWTPVQPQSVFAAGYMTPTNARQLGWDNGGRGPSWDRVLYTVCEIKSISLMRAAEGKARAYNARERRFDTEY